MKNQTNLNFLKPILLAGILCAVFAGCEKEEEVTNHIRKTACETFNGSALKTDCDHGVMFAYEAAKAWHKEKMPVDPAAVFHAALVKCVNEKGPKPELKVKGNADQLMACNIGIYEALSFHEQTLALIKIEAMALVQARPSIFAEAAVQNFSEIPACLSQQTRPELNPAWTGGCVGLSDFSGEQLYIIAREVQAHQGQILVKAEEHLKEAIALEEEKRRFDAETAEVERSIAEWNRKKQNLETALQQTSLSQDRTSAYREEKRQLELAEVTYPERIKAADWNTASAVAQTLLLNNEFSSLQDDLEDAKAKEKRSEDNLASAKSKYKKAKAAKDQRDEEKAEEERRKAAAERRKQEEEEQQNRSNTAWPSGGGGGLGGGNKNQGGGSSRGSNYSGDEESDKPSGSGSGGTSRGSRY
ncbi:MAG: hypothetical protein AB1540_00075 [Bdellovibrionota bacterium]